MGKPGRVFKQGFTLIEVMISCSLLGLVSLGFATVYSQVNVGWLQTANFVAAQNEVTYTSEHIRGKIQRARQIQTIPSLPPGTILGNNNYYGVKFTLDPDGGGPSGDVHAYYMAGYIIDPVDGKRKNAIRYYEDKDLNPAVENMQTFDGGLPYEVVAKDLINPSNPGFFPGTTGDPLVIKGTDNTVTFNIVIQKGGKGKMAKTASLASQIFSRGSP